MKNWNFIEKTMKGKNWIIVIVLGFVEMMEAYLPDFSQIETAKVYEWIVDLENEMSNVKKNGAENSTNDVSIKWVATTNV